MIKKLQFGSLCTIVQASFIRVFYEESSSKNTLFYIYKVPLKKNYQLIIPTILIIPALPVTKKLNIRELSVSAH